MTHAEMPMGYKIPDNYERVSATAIVGHSPYSSSGIDPVWAVIDLKLLGFHCVTATVDLFWNDYLVEGMDQDLIIKMRRRR